MRLMSNQEQKWIAPNCQTTNLFFFPFFFLDIKDLEFSCTQKQRGFTHRKEELAEVTSHPPHAELVFRGIPHKVVLNPIAGTCSEGTIGSDWLIEQMPYFMYYHRNYTKIDCGQLISAALMCVWWTVSLTCFTQMVNQRCCCRLSPTLV